MVLTNNKGKLLAEYKPEVKAHLETLRGLVWPNGSVSASVDGDYRAHWIRDGLYVMKAFEYLGLYSDVYRMIKVPIKIFHRFQEKIHSGIGEKPHVNYKFLHARYDPNNYNELEEQWGHNQLDMLGQFLYEIGDLIKKTKLPILDSNACRDDKYLINKITRYLETLEWWDCPDFGIWEEGPEHHASSIGAVLAGLERIRDLHDNELFFNHKQLAYGRKMLDRILPAESKSDLKEPDKNRQVDMAQLSLIWPYMIVTPKQEQSILLNIETLLVRKQGLARYPKDAYWNGSDQRIRIKRLPSGLKMACYEAGSEGFPNKNKGTEAQWPLGFAWLSICYSKIAKRKFENKEDYKHEKEKARFYLEKMRTQVVDIDGAKYFPELFVNDIPNINTPLAWPTAFFIVAARSYMEIENRFILYKTA